jgi:SpoVK/Ycf46/Vps4 family AAA+-type ATPase
MVSERWTGRIDRKIYVAPPDLESRTDILKISLRGVSTEALNLEELARYGTLASGHLRGPCWSGEDAAAMVDRGMEGFSGAEVVAVCREAAMVRRI